MATTYRHSGKHLPVVSASAPLTSGALAFQEGILGIVVTSCLNGGSTQLDTRGVHNIPVPSGTVKGDRLYADLSAEINAVVLTRTAGANSLVAVAVADRGSDTKALVMLAAQPFGSAVAAGSAAELSALAAAIPVAAEPDVTTANATDLATSEALANALKTSHNSLLAKLRTAGIVAP